ARRRRTSDVRANDHFDGQRLALDALDHVLIGDADEMILRDVLRPLEPPRCEPIEYLALEWDRTEHAVERADAIGDDDEATIATSIIVADLPLVELAEGVEARAFECVAELRLEKRLVDHLRALLLDQSYIDTTIEPPARFVFARRIELAA